MPTERLSMRQIREVLRLRFASQLPQRAIARSLGLSRGAVSGYLSRARAAGVAWPLPENVDDAQLEALLFPPPPAIAADQRPMPDWAWVHRELHRPNVTLALLWEEYRAGAPDGFGYSWFCDLYRGWAGRLKPTMRQTHIAGEKLFVDFAGRTSEVVDARTGELIPVQIFRRRPGCIELHLRRGGLEPEAAGLDPRMSAPSPISAAPHGRQSATISRPGSSRLASTSRWSTGLMPTWRGITAPPSFRRALQRDAPHCSCKYRSRIAPRGDESAAAHALSSVITPCISVPSTSNHASRPSSDRLTTRSPIYS
jgi:Sigma-70, region 4